MKAQHFPDQCPAHNSEVIIIGTLGMIEAQFIAGVFYDKDMNEIPTDNDPSIQWVYGSSIRGTQIIRCTKCWAKWDDASETQAECCPDGGAHHLVEHYTGYAINNINQ